MKQVVLSPRTGALSVADVPVPQGRPGAVLVHNAASVVSAGTERSVIALAGKSLVGKARARPDLVREALNKMRRDGLRATVRESFRRLEMSQPLGYSSAGTVLAVGAGVEGMTPGDRVVCAGAGWANHAEIVVVPAQLCVPLPPEVSAEAGAFAMLGAIALHGVRRAGVGLGEVVAVLGLGILGQLTVQLLRGAGCRVVAHDVDAERVALAERLGADAATVEAAAASAATLRLSGGIGADAVIITASTAGNGPIEFAAELARVRGTVVMVGVTGMEIPRRPFWKKELAFVLSRASGPGAEEAAYERRGVAYPPGYVRWTAGRNMAAFVGGLARGTVRTEPLITHRFSIDRAADAYALIQSGAPHLGVVLLYPEETPRDRTIPLPRAVASREPGAGVGIGVIGSGLFAQTVLLPALRQIPGVRLRGVAATSGLSARTAADRLGFEFCTTDPDAVLGDPHAGAVVIATRNDTHASLVEAALRAGKHVFVEKPLALTPQELTRVLAAYAASPRVLVVGFNRRYSPIVRRIKTFLGDEHPLTLAYHVNAGAVEADHWVHDPVEGGGRWLGEGGHFVDLLQYLTGADPVQVFARASAPEGEPGVSFVISLGFRDGSAGTIVYADGADRAAWRERLDVFGRGIACTLEDFRRAALARGGRVRRVTLREAARGHAEELAAWVAAVQGEAPPPVEMAAYAANTACCFAVLDSVRTGAPVAVEVPGAGRGGGDGDDGRDQR
ncbi:MAG TPA: bi-domain-containing oxidoreductase [bacterium]|nr:bi-domain-containing oxidoreductase [bacterium]